MLDNSICSHAYTSDWKRYFRFRCNSCSHDISSRINSLLCVFDQYSSPIDNNSFRMVGFLEGLTWRHQTPVPHRPDEPKQPPNPRYQARGYAPRRGARHISSKMDTKVAFKVSMNIAIKVSIDFAIKVSIKISGTTPRNRLRRVASAV